MFLHEYSVSGHSRAWIGRHISTATAILSALIAACIPYLADFAALLGLPTHLNSFVSISIGGASLFLGLHWLFDKHLWRTWPFQLFLGVPDLNGSWHCDGKSMTEDGAVTLWQGMVTITQSWERIHIALRTEHSESHSECASIVAMPGGGFVLMFSFSNQPRLGEGDMRAHQGFCKLRIHAGLQGAEGDYFNNHGRTTCGRMTLVKQTS